MFVTDANLGIIGSHEKVAAAFLCFLRNKGQSVDSKEVRKVSTLKNLMSQTTQGLRQNLGCATSKPAWVGGSLSKNILFSRLLDKWAIQDAANQPPKAYLMEGDITLFCMEVIWWSMNVGMRCAAWDIHSITAFLKCIKILRYVSCLTISQSF